MNAFHWDFGMPFTMAGRERRGVRARWARGGLFREMTGEPGPRAERGNVRYLVLDAIATQPRHGYEIMQSIEERTGGSYKPSPGVIYPTLQMLEELGHARATETDGRRVFAITADGKRDLEEHRDDVDDFFARTSVEVNDEHSEEFEEMITRAMKLFKIFRRGARHGRLSRARMRSLRSVIDDALAKVQKILDGEN